MSFYIQNLIYWIESKQNGLFKPQAELLKKCEFIQKDWWFFVKKKTHCTTLFNTIFLCDDFNKANDWSKCRWLIHEAVHLDQWKKKGSARMIAEYAIPSLRRKIEKEAEDVASQWR